MRIRVRLYLLLKIRNLDSTHFVVFCDKINRSLRLVVNRSVAVILIR